MTLFKNGSFPVSFPLFASFQNRFKTEDRKKLPMIGFEPRISDVGIDRSTNCATTTALLMMFAMTSIDTIASNYLGVYQLRKDPSAW